jgi:hypothetical protein
MSATKRQRLATVKLIGLLEGLIKCHSVESGDITEEQQAYVQGAIDEALEAYDMKPAEEVYRAEAVH